MNPIFHRRYCCCQNFGGRRSHPQNKRSYRHSRLHNSYLQTLQAPIAGRQAGRQPHAAFIPISHFYYIYLCIYSICYSILFLVFVFLSFHPARPASEGKEGKGQGGPEGEGGGRSARKPHQLLLLQWFFPSGAELFAAAGSSSGGEQAAESLTVEKEKEKGERT